MKSSGKLYLIPATIAPETTHVIPEQVTTVVRRLDYFLVENLRSARRYISSLKLGIVIEDLHFELYDKHTEFDQIQNLMTPIVQGKDGGIISEAGCPGIADPGALAVQAAHQLDIQVVPLVGPSSILLALMASGLNGQSFTFHGYLPIDKQERKKKLKLLESAAQKTGQCQLLMETPYRNEALLSAIKEVCHPNTVLCIATDVTAPTEMIQTHAVSYWKKKHIEINKVPTIFILGT